MPDGWVCCRAVFIWKILKFPLSASAPVHCCPATARPGRRQSNSPTIRTAQWTRSGRPWIDGALDRGLRSMMPCPGDLTSPGRNEFLYDIDVPAHRGAHERCPTFPIRGISRLADSNARPFSTKTSLTNWWMHSHEPALPNHRHPAAVEGAWYRNRSYGKTTA